VTRVAKRKGKPFTEVKATTKAEELCSRGVEDVTVFAAELMSCLPTEELEHFRKVLVKIRRAALDQINLEVVKPRRNLGCLA